MDFPAPCRLDFRGIFPLHKRTLSVSSRTVQSSDNQMIAIWTICLVESTVKYELPRSISNSFFFLYVFPFKVGHSERERAHQMKAIRSIGDGNTKEKPFGLFGPLL